MQRYFIKLAYDGSDFHGWQVQPNAPTVQEALTTALATFLREPGLETMGCGRTDTGVHAREFYAHFDLPGEAPENLIFRVNQMLPEAIALSDLIKVAPDAHARFDASARTYEYHVHQQRDPFKKHRSTYINRRLAVEPMNEAAAVLKEYQDFTSFSKVHTEVKTNLCRIDFAEWRTNGEELCFTITADRFLRNMVRAVVGTLLEVGLGKMSLSEFRAVIEGMDRGLAGTSAPAHGLYLTKIVYPYLPG